MSTSTDLATTGGAPAGLALTPTPSEAITAAIREHVAGLAAAVEGAEMVVDTLLCPDSFWPLPPGVKAWDVPDRNPRVPIGDESRESFLARRRVAAHTLGGVWRYGMTLGVDPDVAQANIFMVGGRPSMYADFMVAQIKTKGHDHRVIERSRTSCTVQVRRRGGDWLEPVTFTIEDAIEAGYVPGKGPNAGTNQWGKEKKGGNQKYLTDPAAMLYARASSIAIKAEFPDVLRGMVTREEMDDERTSTPVEVVAEVVEPAPRVTATAILAQATPPPAPASVEEPRAEQVLPPAAPREVPPEPVVERMVLPVSKGQLDALKTRFEELNLGGRAAAQRAARMRVLSELVGREIDDPRALTNDEAKTCLDNLAGQNGVRVCVDLGVLTDPADEADAEAATSQAHAAAEAEQRAAADDADPYATYDPSLELDGAEAAAEGQL